MACRFTEQRAEGRLHTQASPVATGESAQLGVAFEHQCRPLNWAELGKPLALCAGALDQTRIVFDASVVQPTVAMRLFGGRDAVGQPDSALVFGTLRSVGLALFMLAS